MVFDLNEKQAISSAVGRTDENPTVTLRKKDCIAQNILEYLLQPFLVAFDHVGNIIERLPHLDVLAFCLCLVYVDDFLNRFVEAKVLTPRQRVLSFFDIRKLDQI